ncbi:MAG: hypothetical protein IBX50_11965 [Marinospirillum sp.]|uniref:hypothetical protein n=1 Tax=Marinospirillum sp. TaxID=2183934 RepID=UPI001A103DE6|nr:hypothetical protein [Marinospirillum sp.]MBE0507414.1 hypothetical protein [Marinospirillum sp.]
MITPKAENTDRQVKACLELFTCEKVKQGYPQSGSLAQHALAVYRESFHQALRQQVAIAEPYVQTEEQHSALIAALYSYAKSYLDELAKVMQARSLMSSNAPNDISSQQHRIKQAQAVIALDDATSQFERWQKSNLVCVRSEVLRARTQQQIYSDSKASSGGSVQRSFRDAISTFAVCLSELQQANSNPAPHRQKAVKHLNDAVLLDQPKAVSAIKRVLHLLELNTSEKLNQLAGNRSFLWKRIQTLPLFDQHQ